MSDAPCIGVTKPEDGDHAAFAAMKLAVRIAGGRVLKLTSAMSWREQPVDGLLLGGGSDVFPEHYDQQAVEGATYDLGRDEMEMYWARKARDERIPVLGICRGAQLLNVANGGSLHQDVAEAFEDTDYPSSLLGHVFYRKSIEIRRASLLRDILETDEIRVNSIHKQAIHRPGDGLLVSARESNGLIQAIEDPERDFYLGIQFHPEFLIHRSVFRRIFERLVLNARRFRNRGHQGVARSETAAGQA